MCGEDDHWSRNNNPRKEMEWVLLLDTGPFSVPPEGRPSSLDPTMTYLPPSSFRSSLLPPFPRPCIQDEFGPGTCGTVGSSPDYFSVCRLTCNTSGTKVGTRVKRVRTGGTGDGRRFDGRPKVPFWESHRESGPLNNYPTHPPDSVDLS